MNKIVALKKEHLKELAIMEVELNRINCSLNRIDVSDTEVMSHILVNSELDVDASKWNLSNVIDMSGMFPDSEFNGDTKLGELKAIEM